MVRRAGPLASIMARNTGLWEVGTKGVLIPACQWLWPPSPAEQERKQGQDIHFLSFPPSLRLGRELLSLSWVPGLQPRHLSQTSRCPACCGSRACSSALCGRSQGSLGVSGPLRLPWVDLADGEARATFLFPSGRLVLSPWTDLPHLPQDREGRVTATAHSPQPTAGRDKGDEWDGRGGALG